jgi:glycosyltransferase involved in cell wall biosynthesis
MSIVAIEAGITGTPVLITDVCGLDEIRDIQGGIVVPATVEGIKKGLAIIDDQKQLEVMGGNLERFVRNRFTWDSVANMHIQLFNSILDTA